MTDPRTFDKYARDYDDVVGTAIGASGESVAFFAELKVSLVRNALASQMPSSILDFGCGIGNTVRLLATAFPSALVTGVDPSAESIDVAKQHTLADERRLRFITHDGTRLPFPDEAFDVGFTANVFHHIPRADHLAWIRELRRVIRPGGALLVFEHNPFNPLTRRSVRLCPFDEGVTLLRPRYTAELLRAGGFLPKRPHYYFFFPRFLGVLRPLEQFLSWLPVGAQYFVLGQRAP
jgi:ubiquinone/menaquinone biosynthesis C-methylase UbiE